jgi:hypothetical protein
MVSRFVDFVSTTPRIGCGQAAKLDHRIVLSFSVQLAALQTFMGVSIMVIIQCQ